MDEIHLHVQTMFKGLGLNTDNKKRRSAIASGLMIATVDPNYTGTGRPKLKFDGASSVGPTLYPHLSSYTPAASERVIVAVFSHSMCILGSIINIDYQATFEFTRSFLFSAPSSDQYVFIARLPASNGGTYDHIRVELIGSMWTAPANMINDWVLFSNRNGFAYQYMQQGDGSRTDFGIQAFSNSDGSVDIYGVGISGQYTAATIKAIGMGLVQNASMARGAITTTAPSGSLVFDSTTATANATIAHG